MDSNPLSHVAKALDRQAFAQQIQSIEEVVPARLGAFVAWAQRLIDRHHVVDRAFAAEDAVQDALLKLWRAAKSGKINSAETEEQLVKLLRHTLDQEVLDERDREHTHKRGGAAMPEGVRASAARPVDAELEAIDSHARPPEEQVIAQDAVERLLWLLDAHDPSLRTVAKGIADGFTHREIAALLGLSLRAVDQRARRIKAILGPLSQP